MKKFYAFFMVAAGILSANAEVSLTPDLNKTYMIEHSSGYYMTVEGEALKIMSENPNSAQTFTFDLVDGADSIYNIKTVDGTYIGSDTGWTVNFLSDPTGPYAQFTFEQSHDAGYLIMHNVGRNGYLGTDSNSDGSTVYTNKGGKDGKELWRFVKIDIESAIAEAEAFLASGLDSEAFPEAAKNVLTEAINNAKESTNPTEASSELRGLLKAMTSLYDSLIEGMSLLETTEVGHVTGGCPEEAKTALEAAVTTAKSAWGEGTAAAYEAAAAAMSEANSTFKAARYAFVPAENAKYYLMNTAPDLAMAVYNNEVVLQAYTKEANQQFEIIPVEGTTNTFNLKIADGSGYVARTGSWNTTVLTDPNEDAAKITFEIYNLADLVYNLKKYNEWGYMAPDQTTEGALVYTDKGDWVANCHWQLFIVEGGTDSVAKIANEGEAFAISLKNGVARVTGVVEGTAVDVFTVDGRKVASVKAVNGVCDIQLEKGCYIVKANAKGKVIYIK